MLDAPWKMLGDMHAAILGPEDPDTLRSAGFLTSAYGEQGRWEEAEEVGRYAMNTCNEVFGPEHPDPLDSMCCDGHMPMPGLSGFT